MTRAAGAASSTPKKTSAGMGVSAQWAVRTTAVVMRILHTVAQHWLLVANALLGIQAILPAVAPLLMVTGMPSLGRLLYTAYSPLCHQLPERSFFLFGLQRTYTLPELERLLGPSVPLRYIGNAVIGYKMTVCQRDWATYAAMWLAGLAFIPLRHRLRPLNLKVFALLSAPMAVDGFGQLFGLWDSTPWRRVVTGALFGAACIWLAFPYIEAGMKDVLEAVEREQSERES